MSKWTNFQPAKVGVVLQSRPAETKFQISLNKGETVQVLAEFNGWFKVELRRPRRSRISEWKLAAYSKVSKRNPELIESGIFPSGLIQIVEQGQTANTVKLPGYSHTLTDYVENSSATLAAEIIQVLKEWSTELQKLYNSQSRKEFQLVKKNMAILVGLRKTILDPHFQKEASKKEKQEIGDRILKVIEEGSRQLNLDMIIRVAKGANKGNRANENNTDILSLYKSYRDLYSRELELKRRAKMAQRNKNNQNSSKRRKKGARGQEEESSQEEVQRSELLRELYDLPDGNVQMLLDIKAALFQVGEPTELYFQLWSHNSKRFVSEEYMIELSTFGLPKDERLIQNMKAVFRDITENQYLDDLFLICRIYRKGKLLWEPSNTPPSSSYLQNKGQAETEGYRRPFGISVLPLTPNIIAENLRNSVEYSPGNLTIFSATQENLFSTLHEQIINNTGMGYERAPSSKAIGIAVGITMFEGEYEEVLEEFKKQVDLSGICSVNMLSFPNVIPPGEMRNDLYISLVSGQTQSGSSQVEARIFVGDDSNPNPCISRYVCTYSEPKKVFVSSVYMNSANPIWNEMFRMNLPPAQMEKSSIAFLVGACQGKKTKTEYYACGIFDIVDEDGVIKKDGTYTVELYKYVKDMEKNLGKTLKDKSKLQPLKNHTLTLKLYAVSTQVTQDSHLSQLLHWKEASKKLALAKIIDQSTFVSNQQIFQFIRVMFDSLFSIATSNDNESILNLVYKAILHVVDALSKKSFMQYQTVVDEYIAKWFHFPSVYKWLTASLLKSLQFDEQQNDKRGLKSVGESLKSFHYLFRFILVSRFEFEEKSAEQAAKDKAQFLEDARNCFVQFNKIMAIQNVNLIAAQDSTLKLIASLFEFDKILTLFATEETAHITKDLIDNIPTTGRKNTTEGKLTILNSIVRGQLGKEPNSRKIILPTLVKNLKVHFNQSATERRLCIAILSELLSTLEKNILSKEEQTESVQETYSALMILFDDIAASQDALKQERDDIAKKMQKAEKELTQLKDPRFRNTALELENELDLLDEDLQKVEQVRGLVIASGLSMLRFTTVDMWHNYLQDNNSKLLVILHFIEASMMHSPYPTFWINWNSFQFYVFLNSLQTIGSYLSTHVNAKHFNMSLWNGYFHNCVQFILAERLQLENFSTSKQSKITVDHGDMRITMSEMIASSFQTLDQLQIHFVPSLVSAVLRYANLEKREISINALNVYYTLLEREFKTNGTVKQCEGATVGMLDEYLNSDGMDDRFKDLFVQTLEDRFRKDSEIEKEGMRFLYQTKGFMEMITTIQRYSDAQEDEKTFALLRVIDSVLSSNREELYFKYIHMLSQIHATNKNFVEAGLCLLLHAYRLSFQSETVLPAINNEYPEEIERVRKEKLYTKAIHYLDEGRDWERAITLIRELAPLYETVTFEYKKLSDLIRREGSLYEKIYDQKRLFASYFYVAYYGKGFREMGLQNKEFIYKGKEAERLPDFIERIVKKFPNSELLKTIDKPPKEIIESEGQHVQIMTVYPCSYEDVSNKLAPKPRNPKLPFNILSYSLNSQVKVFYFTKTYRKNPKDKTMNEMRDLYTTINFLTISPNDEAHLAKCPKNKIDIERSLQCFPSIIRRKEIQSYIDVTLSPVENAVKNLEDKNCELEELIIDHSLSTKPDTQKLSMLLNGMIDAAVNGGINRYIDAFFSGDYLQNSPSELEPLKRFTKALGLQPTLLEKGLQCYKQFGKATTKAHSEHLENLHIQMKEQLKTFFANNKLE